MRRSVVLIVAGVLLLFTGVGIPAGIFLIGVGTGLRIKEDEQQQ